MPKTTPQGQFPFDKDTCIISLFEEGNAPDYSYIYTTNIQAGRGYSESYTLNNAPKNKDHMQIEVTCNPDTESTRFNYLKIDYTDRAGGGAYDKKNFWYFINSKTILNYPSYDPITKKWGGYTVLFDCSLDVWETYKDVLGKPIIHLQKCTTKDPEGWDELGVLDQSILPFSHIQFFNSAQNYDDYKTVIGWQAKKPTSQENYVIDGQKTFLQFNDNGDTHDYLADLEDLANEPPQATNLYQTYVVARSYVLSHYFTTQNGTYSQQEDVNCYFPEISGVHARLKYFPYVRGFIKTLDGQQVEVDQKKLPNYRIVSPFHCTVNHSTVPTPTSCIMPDYENGQQADCVIFNQYPTVDMAGKNVTPVQQLITSATKLESQLNQNGYKMHGG